MSLVDPSHNCPKYISGQQRTIKCIVQNGRNCERVSGLDLQYADQDFRLYYSQ
jgi:hypothetical protein